MVQPSVAPLLRLIFGFAASVCNGSHKIHFHWKASYLLNPFAKLAMHLGPNAAMQIEQPIFQQIERDWHNDIVIMVRDRLPKVATVLVMLFILQRIVRFFIGRMERVAKSHLTTPARAAQLRTMATIVRGTAYSILGFLAFLQLLDLLNFNYGPLLASAGILGVGIGLGAQSLCKDIINGIFIFIEDQYNVGETIKIASLSGTVEDLTLRLTRLRDADGTLYIVPNSQVATVSNLSRDYAVASVSIAIDASADPNRVMALLRTVAQQVVSEEALKDAVMADPAVNGIDNINGRALTYSISARVRIAQKDQVLRALRTSIVETFKREQIPLGVDPINILLQKVTPPDPTATPPQQTLIGS